MQRMESITMDILDIDEELKDDSFIFLEDKTHDDVSNILQQWKTKNNCQLTQQQPEQVFKLNSRTFTRPKKKLAQNLEAQFSNACQNAYPHSHAPNDGSAAPMLNLEIGGLVTNMQKSFLMDTSPPSSICSSNMDMSVERMNNSLITSADFTNINFLQSTQSLEFKSDALYQFNLKNTATSDGYTLSDMIRDRQALESLTMSGDGTLTKDSQIAQIDDISLALSKTASGCSTMDNSTESVEDGLNRTVEFVANRTFEGGVQLELTAAVMPAKTEDEVLQPINNIMQRTMILSNELIGDTTFDLVENSIYAAAKGDVLNLTHDLTPRKQTTTSQTNGNDTFKKPFSLNETVCITTAPCNTTYECALPDERCATPESNEKPSDHLKFCESTPLSCGVRYKKQPFTPSLKIPEDVNISPIVANGALNGNRALNETYDPPVMSSPSQNAQPCNKSYKIPSSKAFTAALPEVDSMEMLDHVENPYETFNQSYQQQLNSTHSVAAAAERDMQNVMNKAQAEAELLVAGGNGQDEAHFEHLLDEFSKVELNAEQRKMKQSLDNIKKRFNCGLSNSEKPISREAQDMREMLHEKEELQKLNINGESKSKQENIKSSLRESMFNSRDSAENSLGVHKPLNSPMGSSSGSGTGERLLSRRSRLYDDFNLTIAAKQIELEDERETEKITEAAKTEGNMIEETTAAASDSTAYKLAEKRERDRDRFKTIKIVKQKTPSEQAATEIGNEAAAELNVPCIDDEINCVSSPISGISQRLSRKDETQTAAPLSVFNNNKSEIEHPTATVSKINSNFLTYKKPASKEKSSKNLPEIYSETLESSNTNVPAAATAKTRPEPRSLSRPRYLSGIQKFSAVSKATSAGDLEKTASNSRLSVVPSLKAPSSNTSGISTKLSKANKSANGATTEDLKSPMGIKSKSFHNLSSNFGYAAGGIPAPKSTGYGLKKLNTAGSAGVLTEKQLKVNPLRVVKTPTASVQQSNDETVFKVPKLVSGLRAPAGGGSTKRAALVRPSSGYYSLNVNSKGVTSASDAESDTGRHSPESMSSASSRGSLQGGGGSSGLKPPTTTRVLNNSNVNNSNAGIEAQLNLTKITTGASGVPKPSGLRPPSNIKRSGLPRPASIARR